MPKKREDLYKSVFAEDTHTQEEAQSHTHVVTHTHTEEVTQGDTQAHTQAHTQAKPGILPLPEPKKAVE